MTNLPPRAPFGRKLKPKKPKPGLYTKSARVNNLMASSLDPKQMSESQLKKIADNADGLIDAIYQIKKVVHKDNLP